MVRACVRTRAYMHSVFVPCAGMCAMIILALSPGRARVYTNIYTHVCAHVCTHVYTHVYCIRYPDGPVRIRPIPVLSSGIAFAYPPEVLYSYGLYSYGLYNHGLYSYVLGHRLCVPAGGLVPCAHTHSHSRMHVRRCADARMHTYTQVLFHVKRDRKIIGNEY